MQDIAIRYQQWTEQQRLLPLPSACGQRLFIRVTENRQSNVVWLCNYRGSAGVTHNAFNVKT